MGHITYPVNRQHGSHLQQCRMGTPDTLAVRYLAPAGLLGICCCLDSSNTPAGPDQALDQGRKWALHVVNGSWWQLVT